MLPTASTAFTLPHFQRGSLTALPGGRQKRVEELQAEDFLGCTASAELHLSPCLVQGIRRSPHAGFAYLQVYLGDQDRQVRTVPSYGEKGTLGELGPPAHPAQSCRVHGSHQHKQPSFVLPELLLPKATLRALQMFLHCGTGQP